jgi:transposase InsO family protein
MATASSSAAVHRDRSVRFGKYWYNNARLHSLLDNATPEEFEQAYYAHETGSPTGDAANQKTA